MCFKQIFKIIFFYNNVKLLKSYCYDFLQWLATTVHDNILLQRSAAIPSRYNGLFKTACLRQEGKRLSLSPASVPRDERLRRPSGGCANSRRQQVPGMLLARYLLGLLAFSCEVLHGLHCWQSWQPSNWLRTQVLPLSLVFVVSFGASRGAPG